MLASQRALEGFEPTPAVGVVGLVLVLVSVALFPLARALAGRLFPARTVIFARWGFFHAGLAILFYFSAMIAGAGALGAAGVDLQGGLAPVLFSAALQLATVALVATFAHRLDPDGVRSLGLRAGGWLGAAGVGLVGYVAVLPAILGSMALSAWGWTALGVELEVQDVLRLVLELDGAERALFVVLAVAVIPLLEELFFRAFLQPLLVQNLGDRAGVVLTAAIFAAVHGNVFAFLPIFTLALALGLVMLRTQRVVGAWLVHALHNGLTLALVLSAEWARQLGGAP